MHAWLAQLISSQLRPQHNTTQHNTQIFSPLQKKQNHGGSGYEETYQLNTLTKPLLQMSPFQCHDKSVLTMGRSWDKVRQPNAPGWNVMHIQMQISGKSSVPQWIDCCKHPRGVNMCASQYCMCAVRALAAYLWGNWVNKHACCGIYWNTSYLVPLAPTRPVSRGTADAWKQLYLFNYPPLRRRHISAATPTAHELMMHISGCY